MPCGLGELIFPAADAFSAPKQKNPASGRVFLSPSVTGLNVFQQLIRYSYSHGRAILNGSRLFSQQVFHSYSVKCVETSPRVTSSSRSQIYGNSAARIQAWQKSP